MYVAGVEPHWIGKRAFHLFMTLHARVLFLRGGREGWGLILIGGDGKAVERGQQNERCGSRDRKPCPAQAGCFFA